MGGFNYGGQGDGTNWSSERGSGPAPGGGGQVLEVIIMEVVAIAEGKLIHQHNNKFQLFKTILLYAEYFQIL